MIRKFCCIQNLFTPICWRTNTTLGEYLKITLLTTTNVTLPRDFVTRGVHAPIQLRSEVSMERTAKRWKNIYSLTHFFCFCLFVWIKYVQIIKKKNSILNNSNLTKHRVQLSNNNSIEGEKIQIISLFHSWQLLSIIKHLPNESLKSEWRNFTLVFFAELF